MTYNDILNAWQKKEISTKEDLDVSLSDYRGFFAYHSKKIEGAGVSLHQTREIFENGKVVGYTGDLRVLFETENQRVCFEFLKEKTVDKEKLTPSLICRIHELLCRGCYDESRWAKGERRGEFKKNYYGVGLSVGVPPEDVEEEVNYICEELADVKLRSQSKCQAPLTQHNNHLPKVTGGEA